jgi:hypothetical protein
MSGDSSLGFEVGFGGAMGALQGHSRGQSIAGAMGGAGAGAVMNFMAKNLSQSKNPFLQVAHGVGTFAIPMLGAEGAIRLSQKMRMRKHALDSATGAPAPNAGTVGPAPTLDACKRRRKNQELVEVTKNAAWEKGAAVAMAKTFKAAPLKAGPKPRPPRASTKMGLGTEELLPSINASSISSTPNYQPPRPRRI